MLDTSNLDQVIGSDLYGSDGDKIGTVGQVKYRPGFGGASTRARAVQTVGVASVFQTWPCPSS